jgi:DNA (cytosine-5)-methyltransferase 1
MAQRREPVAIDLFCGAGGLTAGLEAAGFQTAAVADHDADCIETLKATKAARIPVPDQPDRHYLDGTRILKRDIASMTAKDLRPDGAPHNWRPDLLAGGPPCQPFSSAGRRLGVDDPRGRMFVEFVRLASELRPRYILFENVRGLLTARDPEGRPGGVLEMVQRSFEEIGYACRWGQLNAADYGAPQRRVRLFMIAACDRAIPPFPSPSHDRLGASLFDQRKPWVTLGEFLSSQPEPDPNDVVRPSGVRVEQLLVLQPGTGLKANGIIEANRPSGHWGYRQDSFLADPHLPSRTIRAATTPDWIRTSDGTMRRLTWRECAGLQGFPEGWQFRGTIASLFRQIGNAVQGDVATVLGMSIRAALGSGRPTCKPVSAPWPPEFKVRIDYTAMEHRVNGRARRERRIAE